MAPAYAVVPRSPVIGAFLVAAVAVLAGSAIAAVSPGTRAISLAVVATAVVAPVARRSFSGRFDPLEPIFVFALAYGVMFFIHPISTLVSGDLVYRIAGRGVGIDETFDPMLVLAAAGAIGFVAGYEVPFGARLAARFGAPAETVDRRWMLGTALAFAAVGLLLFASFVIMKGGASGLQLVFSGRSAQLNEAVGDSSKYLYFGPLLIIPAAVVALAFGLSERRRSLLLLAGLLALTVLVVRGPVGSRMTLLPLFAGMLTLIVLVRGRRPGPLAVIALLLVALTASAFLVGIRDASQRERTGINGVVSQIASDPVRIFDPLLQGHDAAEASALAAAMTLVPSELPHTYGRSQVADVLLRPVPRSLWVGKPRPPREQAIQLLWPDLYRTGAANPEFSALFVFFLDGGILGVLAGMFVYGLLLRAGYAYLRAHSGNFTVRIAYALSLPVVVILLRDSLTDTLARWAFLFVPLIVGYFVATRRRAQM
jgi:hypothetical protein